MFKKVVVSALRFPLGFPSVRKMYNSFLYFKWIRDGRPVPPVHVVKQRVIDEYRKKHGLQVLVETGTYFGDMIYAHRKNFKKIYSVELSEMLWEKAVKRFKKYDYINILQGDSGNILQDLVPKLSERVLFWLDGHYSAGVTARGEKDCPIFEELHAILKSDLDHILLVDDARCFEGIGDYPTIDSLRNFILKHRAGSVIEIKDDVIRIELS